MKIKLGILTTHPIQYQVPWFRELASKPEFDLTVFFCMLPDTKQQGEGFGVAFEWDVPLLDGYEYRVLKNVSSDPAVVSFKGCDTPEISAIVKDETFDAFIVNGWVVKSCLQLLWACKKHHVPCIVRGESNNLRPRVWWKKLIHRQLLSRYSAYLYIGEGNRNFYLGNGVPEDKLFFAPYCIDNKRFSVVSKELLPQRDSIRDGWNIPQDAVTSLFCAKFIPKKRPMDCLRALSLLKARDAENIQSQKFHLLMVGSGELLEECKAFTREHDLPVTFAGFLNQSEIPKAYVAADCQLLPSDNGETWGLVVNEGMACGLPAIVSDQVGCHMDLIKSGETGEVYPCGNVEELADAMQYCVANPAQLRLMGAKSRALIQHYSYDTVVEGTCAALKSVVAKGCQFP